MVDESVLDEPDRLVEADPEGMLRALASAGPQLRRTVVAAQEADVRRIAEDGTPRSIIVLGTGVAAIAAAAVAAAAGQPATAPILVHRGADLPRWVGAADMVIGLSPTGAGAQALAVAQQAAARGARVVGVGPDDSPLAAVVAGARGPYVAITESRWRRATLWPLLAGLATLVNSVGVVEISDELLERTAVALDDAAITSRIDSESVVNPAKQLAIELVETAPVIWAGSELAAVAGRRFAESLAGMAAVPAPSCLLDGDPQAFGLFGAGVGGPTDIEDIFADRVDEPVGPKLRPVLLREPAMSPMLERARELAEYYRLPVSEVGVDDAPALVRFAQYVGQLDLAAAYLAIAMGQDPAREVTEGPAQS
jgi:glucose/mannose-6-phosphate isomerase